jgi:hypothetical protein
LRAGGAAAWRTAAGGGDATAWGVGATAAGNEVFGVDGEVDEPLGFGCAPGAGSGCKAGGGGGAGSGPGPSASARPSKPARTATQRPRASVAERSAVNSSPYNHAAIKTTIATMAASATTTKFTTKAAVTKRADRFCG